MKIFKNFLKKSSRKLTRNVKNITFNRWQKIVVAVMGGLIVLVMTVFLGYLLAEKEEKLIQEKTLSTLSSLKLELVAQTKERILALLLLAESWNHQNLKFSSNQLKQADYLFNDLQGYEAIGLIQLQGQISWFLPSLNQQQQEYFRQAWQQSFPFLKTEMGQKKLTIITSSYPWVNGKHIFLVYVPVYFNDDLDNEQLQGYVVGIFEMQRLFNTLNHLFKDYEVTLFEDNQEFFHIHPTNNLHIAKKLNLEKWLKATDIQFHNHQWTLQILPTGKLIEIHQSKLPQIILIGGSILSFLVSMIIYLRLKNRAYIQELEINNFQLAENIKKVESTQEKLQESQRFIEQITQSIPNLVYIYDLPEQKFIYINNSVTKILGYSLKKVQNINFTLFKLLIHQEDQVTIYEHLQDLNSLQDHEIMEVEYRIKNIQGEWHWFCSRETIFQRNSQQLVTQVLGIAEDITERKRSQEILAEKEERLDQIVKTISDALVVVDYAGKVLFVNPAAEVLFGRSKDQLLDSILGLPCIVNKTIELEIHHSNGQLMLAEMRAVDFKWQQETAYLLSLRNITERKKAEANLQKSEQEYRRIVETAAEGIWIIDENNLTIFVNQQMTQMLGYSVQEMMGKYLFFFMDKEETITAIEKVELRRQGVKEKHDFKFRRRDGTVLWAILSCSPLFDSGGQYKGALAMVTDITERKLVEQQLEYLAFYDSLTNLPNRILFMHKLQEALQKQQTNDHLLAILFLDLDSFKVINDSLGHFIGDNLLQCFGAKLIECIRPNDICARYGGDEFIILIDELQDFQQVIKIVERIHKTLKKPFYIDDQEIFTNTSIGIATSRSGIETPETLVRDADTAMYQAKAMGKGRYAIFTPKMHHNAVSRLQLERDLRQAIDRNQFIVYYQPIVSLIHNQLTSFEALIRWQHPVKGLISPNLFIPLAEETGLIIPLGEWILTNACQQLKIWHQQFREYANLKISINISGRQLKEENFLLKLDQILLKTGLEPKFIKLEITEGILIENIKTIKEILFILKEQQFTLSLDDFGTGYSSLSYLHRFPFDILKIDRSFIQRINKKGDNSEIVEAIINLAHNLHLEVIAEGIENSSQLQQLKELRCENGQGYLFSRPLTSQSATKYILNFANYSKLYR